MILQRNLHQSENLGKQKNRPLPWRSEWHKLSNYFNNKTTQNYNALFQYKINICESIILYFTIVFLWLCHLQCFMGL